jgi:AcrR family transcriptional regulator
MPRKNVTRDTILAAAVAVFSRQGYAKATMNEIAASAGVAKGSLYYNFPNKARLFASIYSEGYEAARSRVMAAIDSQSPPEAIIDRVVRILTEMFLEFPDLAGILFYSIPPELDPPTYDDVVGIREKFIRLVGELITKGVEEGVLKDLDPELTAIGLVSMTLAICLRTVNPQNGTNRNSDLPLARREKIADLISTMVMRGVMLQ